MKTKKQITQDLAEIFLFRTLSTMIVVGIFFTLAYFSHSAQHEKTKDIARLSPIHTQSISKEHRFLDVEKDYPYATAIEYAYENGIIQGFNNGTMFHPEEYVSRAELVTIVSNIMYGDDDQKKCLQKYNRGGASLYLFPDVPADSWFTASVCLASANEIVKGYPDGYFRPHQRVSFAESAKILAKIFNIEDETSPKDAWFAPAVRGLAKQNAIPTTIFSFDSPVTRGEFVEILYRIREKRIEKPSLTMEDFSLHYAPPTCTDCLVIPKLNIQVPIVYGVAEDSFQNQQWGKFEQDVLAALRNGVVHYPNTALPGMIGNVFLSGHSSYYQNDPGKYKDVFAKLGELKTGDEYMIYYQGKRFLYKIQEQKIIQPDDFSALSPPTTKELSTLMTCYPVYTNKQRKIFVAERVM